MALKLSNKQYRNIDGKRFECYSSNPSDFNDCQKEAKEMGLKFRIIDKQFYIEKK